MMLRKSSPGMRVVFFTGILITAVLWNAGCDGSKGTSQSLPTCGNGVVDPGEACDDGNTQSGDGCSADCSSTEVCGNGVLDPGEACDDGNTQSGDGCSADCSSTEVCGNGILDIGEECDDGTSNSRTPNACRPGCHLPVCGDGIVDSEFGEVCDDGNTRSGDGCSYDCRSTEVCGNGIIDPGEECDDGNFQNWDGCNSCRIAEFRVNTYTKSSQAYSSVAMAPDGRFVVVWVSYEQDGDGHGIYARVFGPDGTPETDEFQVNTYTNSRQESPDVAMAADGHFIVVWQSLGQEISHTTWGIVARLFNPDGTPDGDEFQVNIYTADDQMYPRVAMASDGRFVVVWESYRQDGSGWGIYSLRFTSSGEWIGTDSLVNTHTASDQVAPVVAMNDYGRYTVVWQSYGQDGSASGIYGQILDASVPLGGNFQINTYTQSSQEVPKIAMTPDGYFVVVWQSMAQDWSGYGVYAQRYTPDGTPIGTGPMP